MCAMNTGGGGGTIQTPSYKTKGEKLTKSIVIDEVKIIEETRIYEVPKVEFKIEQQTKYDTVNENQIKYVTKEEPTVKYIPKEEETIRYIPKEEKTVRYIVEDQKVERPVPVDKLYEKPVLKEVEYNLVTFKDLEAIQKALELMPKLIENLNSVIGKLYQVKDYKLVEEEIKVPKITYIPTEVERIVWKDVPRERPK
jgi:hypothetical protein